MACWLLLTHVDFSVLYHTVRGQSVIKLYVIYNMLEVNNLPYFVDYCMAQSQKMGLRHWDAYMYLINISVAKSNLDLYHKLPLISPPLVPVNKTVLPRGFTGTGQIDWL